MARQRAPHHLVRDDGHARDDLERHALQLRLRRVPGSAGQKRNTACNTAVVLKHFSTTT